MRRPGIWVTLGSSWPSRQPVTNGSTQVNTVRRSGEDDVEAAGWPAVERGTFGSEGSRRIGLTGLATWTMQLCAP